MLSLGGRPKPNHAAATQDGITPPQARQPGKQQAHKAPPAMSDRNSATASKVDQFGRPVLAERLDGLPIAQFGQCTMMEQGGSDIVGNCFVTRKIAGPLAQRRW